MDVRLLNTSQLAGFTKADDLAFLRLPTSGDWINLLSREVPKDLERRLIHRDINDRFRGLDSCTRGRPLTPPHSCRFGFGGIPAASLSSLIIASRISFSILPQLPNSILSSMAAISASVCPWSRISLRVLLNSRSIGCMSCKTNCLQLSSIKRGPFARWSRSIY
jgi:hypothetical protein